VRWTRKSFQRFVIAGSGIFVSENGSKWCASQGILKKSRDYFKFIFFCTFGGKDAGARLSAGHGSSEFVKIWFETGWKMVNGDANRRAVGFSEQGILDGSAPSASHIGVAPLYHNDINVMT
jgi:hypothetical protein